MTLSAPQITSVQKTWDSILALKPEAGELFYNRLFTLNPSLRLLFNKDIKSQADLLVNMISFAVKRLHDIPSMVADVRALGTRHRAYNVKGEHYATVADALLWTLEQGLGDDWTEETKSAWVAVYTLLSTTMQEAASEK